MSRAYDVLVVGAGNLGLWAAYHLARRGAGRIAVCERIWAGFGATSRSAGMIRAQGGTTTAIVLGRTSRELYRRLGAELGLDAGFVETGYYVLAETPAEEALFRRLVERRRALGVACEWVDAAEGRRRFPALDWTGLRGATYAAEDGYVHPPLVARNVTFAVARSEAVDLFEACPVSAIERDGSGFVARTPRGRLTAERIVLAGGPRGARELGTMVGLTVPVAAVRHHVVTYARLSREIGRPFPQLFALGRGFYLRPEEEGALVGMMDRLEAPDDSGRYQLPFDRAYVDRRRSEWEERFPPLAGQPISRAWAAAIDYTPDHLPIVDEPAPGIFLLAAGGHGMMWGPALGQKLAELLLDGRATELPDAEIRLARFAAGASGAKGSGEGGAEEPIALPFPFN